jgi:hemolysin activation/secretion protein
MAASLYVGLLLGQVSAQNPTPSENIRDQQSRERVRIEQQIQQATAPLPTLRITSPQAPPPDIEGKSPEKVFKLNQVIFDAIPNAVSPAELDAITAKYVAMDKVSMRDLYLMVVEIDALFDRKHVPGRAGLPVQDVDNGIVTVQIVEGRESKRTITVKAPSCFGLGDSPRFPIASKRPFDQSFVQHQFRFSGRQSLNLEALEEEILRYNRTFRSQLAAEIEPGEDLGQCTLKLTRLLPQPISGGYSVDNSGRETSGRIRTGLYLNLVDTLGLNDSFMVSYDKTEGTTSLYMQGDIPISRFGTFADMSYYYGEPKTISGPLTILDINGTSEQYHPGLRQILVNGKEQRLDATLYYQNYHSQTFFGPARQYVEKHDAVTVGLEYSHRKQKSAAFAGMSVIAGHAETLAPIPIDPVGSDFCSMKMNLIKIWYPTPKWTLILRGNGSAALSALPQSQVFQIGGMVTVRGTPEAMMSGESGYLASAEVRRLVWSSAKLCCSAQEEICRPKPCCPLQRLSGVDYLRDDWRKHSRAEIFAFLDHGGVFYRDTDLHLGYASDFLSTVGTGATVQIGKHGSLSGGYGQPIFTAWSHAEAYRTLLRRGNAFFTAKVSF